MSNDLGFGEDTATGPTEEKDPGWSFRIAGVSFVNDDGSSRQEKISQLSRGNSLKLEYEPKNKYDKNAIKVLAASGQIGYVPAKICVELKKWLEDHPDCRVIIATMGRQKDSGHWGVRVVVRDDG